MDLEVCHDASPALGSLFPSVDDVQGAQGDMAFAPDDDVVVQAHPHRFQGVAHFAGQGDVVARRRGVAGWVVVGHDEGGGAEFKRALIHQRTSAGRTEAKKRGVRFGRPPDSGAGGARTASR